MAQIIFATGQALDTVPAGQKVAIFSWSSLKLYQKVGYPNYPDSWNLVTETTAGETYTSAAFTNATDIRIEAGPADAFYEIGAAPVISEPYGDITAAATPWVLAGLSAAQGGSATVKGGTSSTAGNAGGAATILGGVPGATGVGGAASVTAGAGGATSGAGGVASVTGGAGTNGNAAGGAATVTGGAGQGTGAGGAATITAGASGAGATGNGGDVSLVGGAAASTNGGGGSVILTPGAKAGSGIAGGVFLRSATSQIWRQQVVSTAEADGNQAVAAADMINGICVHTVTTGRTLTTPTGAELLAVCPADIAAGDSFDFTVITVGAGADDISTLTAGDGDITFVGPVTVGGTTGHGGTGDVATWRFRYTGANAFVGYRIA